MAKTGAEGLRDYGASSYASRLTPRTEKGGGLGLPEKEEEPCVASKKILKLAELIRNCKSCVVLTGAGISTSAGVSDFRGPNGVWTAEKKGVAPPASKSFDTVQPTTTHMALVGLVKAGLVKLIISQNVDGLHLRSHLPRDKLAELHGNLFIESCEVCGWEYLRDFDVGGISFSKTGRICQRAGCGGALRNNLLDWEDSLPEQEFQVAEDALREADLCICMGTSLRIRPASELPLLTVKKGGKLVILNLQKTPKDRHAHLRIQTPVDDVVRGVMAALDVPIPKFERSLSLVIVARRHTSTDALENAIVPQTTEARGSVPRMKEEEEEERGRAKDEWPDALSSKMLSHAAASGEERGESARAEEYQSKAALWRFSLISPVGRRCPLPLIERVTWKCAGFGDMEGGGKLEQGVGPDTERLTSVIAARYTREGGPGKLSAEIFLADSCSFPSKIVQVCEDEWAQSRGDGVVGDGEWFCTVDLSVVDHDFSTRPRQDVVQELEEQAKRAPNGKRSLGGDEGEEFDEGPAKKSAWRKCATCGKAGRVPRGEASQAQEWYCRRRCRVEGPGGDATVGSLPEALGAEAGGVARDQAGMP